MAVLSNVTLALIHSALPLLSFSDRHTVLLGMISLLNFSPVSVSMHLWNLPIKVLTPMMAKMSQKIKHTKSTLKIDGKAPTKALTTTFMPSILAIARSGRRALSVLMVLKMGMLPAPRKEKE